jgi:acetyl-CoA carboxylase carboxyltransferase component
MEVPSPLTGVVVEVIADDGAAVSAGASVLLLEAMKMHQEVAAPASGVVREIAVAVGDQVQEGQLLFQLEEREVETPAAEDGPAAATGVERSDLAEAIERRRLTSDEARPGAVERRRELGRRTTRENIADLCDPGSFVEYGGLAVAAQRARRSEQELIEQTPADGIVTGIGAVNGDTFGEGAGRCVVLAYDYTVLAGTQGVRNHRKTDRLLDLADRERLPIVLFAEGGGGRPGDTDRSELFHLDVPTFRNFARLSGLVPRIGIVSGRCFAGNAALLGCCDVIIATPEATIGMGGPAMIEGGGLGSFEPEEVGPVEVLAPAGVIDLVADDEAGAVDAARRFLAYFQGSLPEWSCADQQLLREIVPEDRQRVHDPQRVLELLADEDSVMELRPQFGRTMITALVRIEGQPLGVIANDPRHLGGAIDADGAEKAARFIQLCDALGLPLVSLVDTPGFMVGPESERAGMVRRCSRLFLAAATSSVPLVSVVVRRAYGLGAQAMTGGDFHAPVLNVAWPTGEFGAMGVEGAVRLAMRKELEAIEDEGAREVRVKELVGAVMAQAGALNMATHFEIDDVIDPAETRDRIVAALRSARAADPHPGKRRTMVDSW